MLRRSAGEPGTDLIVEAYVRPQDIDEVRVGQAARLKFSALDQRETPPVPGEAMHVSTDWLENERTGKVYRDLCAAGVEGWL